MSGFYSLDSSHRVLSNALPYAPPLSKGHGVSGFYSLDSSHRVQTSAQSDWMRQESMNRQMLEKVRMC